MDLKQIRDMVGQDMPIDETCLDRESLNVPRLHSKYLNILHDEKLILHKYKIDLYKLQKLSFSPDRQKKAYGSYEKNSKN